jgi:hypothetical protein
MAYFTVQAHVQVSWENLKESTRNTKAANVENRVSS